MGMAFSPDTKRFAVWGGEPFALEPAHSQEREKLRVSTLFIGSSLVPLWIAQEQGIFARNGVDVELIWMQSTLSTTALLAGEVDVVFGTPQTILAVLTAKNPPPLVTIAAWGSASEHWLSGLRRLGGPTFWSRRFRREAPLIRNASDVRRIACWKRVFQLPVEFLILLALRTLLARSIRHGVSSVPLG